jgi:hypothetical protein
MIFTLTQNTTFKPSELTIQWGNTTYEGTEELVMWIKLD